MPSRPTIKRPERRGRRGKARHARVGRAAAGPASPARERREGAVVPIAPPPGELSTRGGIAPARDEARRGPGGAAGPPLSERVFPAGTADAAEVAERFLAWVRATGLAPYTHQVEALEALAEGRHVILNTPTGSGKSLVALGLHFRALCEGRRSFYTSPTKALASEKFFDLCERFGAEQVGMLTGDASINREAPVICCTAEVLANMVLGAEPEALPPYVVADEFHYYADRDRGAAWQVPLVMLPDCQFLLMSATLGDMQPIAAHLEARSGRPVRIVASHERPVPLDYSYRETPLHDTVRALVDGGLAPLYVVSFTQREATALAQALTSLAPATAEQRGRVAAALEGADFDTPFGKELRRLLRAGIGVHHAGLLPKYRLLVEQLAQAGLLVLICGTDTLGVGVNIPIRTVVFNGLAKFDGEKLGLLSARDFRQIAGRAGRRGFDDRGSVVCQAPPHVIENRRLTERRAGRGRGGSGGRGPRAKAAPPGSIVWSKSTFEALLHRPAEPLESRFRVNHAMLIHALGRRAEPAGYRCLVHLIQHCHEPPSARPRLLRETAVLFRALRRAGLIELRPRRGAAPAEVIVSEALQEDFALHQPLSLYLVETMAQLHPGRASYALDVVTLVEAILEDPRAILIQQERTARAALIESLKSAGVPYEDRVAAARAVTWPQPRADFVRNSFARFAARHPWVQSQDIHPKSIARDLFERGAHFNRYVQHYRLQRSEGLLLRHLSQVYKTLVQTVPEAYKTDALQGLIAELRDLITGVDASLIAAWERMVALEREMKA